MSNRTHTHGRPQIFSTVFDTHVQKMYADEINLNTLWSTVQPFETSPKGFVDKVNRPKVSSMGYRVL